MAATSANVSSTHLSATTPSDESSPSKSDQLYTHACVTCAHRKIKCDKKAPACTACEKSRNGCVYRLPLPPQRRKRKVVGVEQELLEKIRKYEETLRSAGIQFDTFDRSNDDLEGRTRDRSANSVEDGQSLGRMTGENDSLGHGSVTRGAFIVENDGAKFYEHSLMANLSKEFNKDPREFADELAIRQDDMSNAHSRQETTSKSLASSLVVGQLVPMEPPGHPSPVIIKKLWTIFLSNVQPLTMLLHTTTLNRVVEEASTNLDHLSKGTEALLCAMYACAIMSLNEAECQQKFGISQEILLLKYQSAVRHVLLSVSFLKTGNLEILQAFVLLLTSMHDNCDVWSQWILVGVAIRLAQSQGLHHDGAKLGLSAFEVEIRRRLWWYIVVFNTRATEITGFSSSVLPQNWNTQLPLNVNDSDIFPEMKVPPVERVGATDMIFCLYRYETAKYLLEHGMKTAPGSSWSVLPHNGNLEQEQQTRLRKIADLESLLENKFLRFCDLVVPLHLLTSTMARSVLCKLRHLECHMRYLEDKRRAMSDQDKDEILSYAVRNLSYDNMLQSTRSVRGYIWYVQYHFPWGAPIHTLKALAAVSEWSDREDTAWQQIEEQHFHHPEYSETKKSMYIIIGDLTLKTWTAREASQALRGLAKSTEPHFIQKLRSRRNPLEARQTAASIMPPLVAPNNAMFEQGLDGGWNSSLYGVDLGDMDFSLLDWNQWNNVPGDFE